MNPSIWLLLLLFPFLSLSASAQTINIYYNGDLNGAIEPCGCSNLGKLGGLQRHAVFLKGIDRDLSLLISNGGVNDNNTASEMIKVDYMLKGMSMLGYDAIGLQSRDMAFGSELLLQNDLPWVSSNLLVGEVPSSRHLVVNSVPVSIHVLSKVDSDNANPSMTGYQLRGNDFNPQKDGLNILMTEYHIKRIPSEFDLSPYDIVIYRHRLEFGAEPQIVDGQIRLGPGIKGMFMGYLQGQWKDGRFEMTDHEFIKIGTEYDQPNRLSTWFGDYEAALKKDYEERAALREAIDSSATQFQGSAACKTCHSSEYNQWISTKHALAFETLLMVEKQYDPSCVKCHVVGFDQEGGYLDEYLTRHLQGVGCENCHGPGRDHIQSVGKVAMQRGNQNPELCLSCHRDGHSPQFEFKEYWNKIKH